MTTQAITARRPGQSSADQYMSFMSSFRTDYPEVQVEPLPAKYRDLIMRHINMKACYNNSFDAVANLKMHGIEAHYVAGMADHIIPVDHAWIVIDGVHYDPTWEKTCGIAKSYFPVTELSLEELVDAIQKNRMCPPSALDAFCMFGTLAS